MASYMLRHNNNMKWTKTSSRLSIKRGRVELV